MLSLGRCYHVLLDEQNIVYGTSAVLEQSFADIDENKDSRAITYAKYIISFCENLVRFVFPSMIEPANKILMITILKITLVLLCGGKWIVYSPKKHLVIEQMIESLLNLIEMNTPAIVIKSPPQEFVKIEEWPRCST